MDHQGIGQIILKLILGLRNDSVYGSMKDSMMRMLSLQLP